MKKVNALVLGLAVLLAVGCGKDEKKGDPEPAVIQPQNQKDCKIKKMIRGNIISEFVYDATGKLSKIKRAQTDSPDMVWLSDSVLYSSGLITQVDHYLPNNFFARYQVYEYDNQNRLSKIAYFQRSSYSDPFLQKNASTFTYDATGKLKERYDTSPSYSATAPHYKLTYTYLPGNIIQEDCFQISQFQLYHISSREWQIDNNKSPFLHIGFIESLNSTMLLTPYNVVFWKDTYINGQVAIEKSSTTFTYNADGYPTKAILIENEGKPVEFTYQYNCQ